MQNMLKLRKLFFFVFILIPFILEAKSFEGSITMVKESFYDTTFFTYFVSDGRIRIEECNSKKELLNIYLVNTNNNEVLVINPTKKMYTKLKKLKSTENVETHFTIKKSDNYKMVQGVKCYQWRVKNREKNSEISYWVTQNNFDFFEKMVNVLNQTDRSWEFFNRIPNSQGFFPMLLVERNLLRDEKMRTAVLQINSRSLDTSIFSVPKGFKMFIM
jgi:hypothetical protein